MARFSLPRFPRNLAQIAIGALALGLTLGVAVPPAAESPAGAVTAGTRPVIVELFTSQGCSTCPEADRLLAEFTKRQPVEGVQVIPVVHHVDYWDTEDWKDPYSTEEATLRQYSYAAEADTTRIYTPQMIVNGGAPFVGNRRTEALKAIHRAVRKPERLKVTIDPGSLQIVVGAPPAGNATFLNMAVTEHGLGGEVVGGENRGRQLHHDGVVRWHLMLGPLDSGIGAAIQPRLPEEFFDEGRDLRLVAFVQREGPGKILGASAAALPASAP